MHRPPRFVDAYQRLPVSRWLAVSGEGADDPDDLRKAGSAHSSAAWLRCRGHSHVRRYRRRMGLTAIRPHTRSFMSVRCAGDDLCIQSGLHERFSGSLARYVPRDGSRANLSCVFVFATGSRPAVCQEGKSLRRIVDDLRRSHIDLNEDRFRPASGHGFCYHVSILQANHMIGFPAGHDSIEWVSRTRIDTPQAVSVFAAVAVSSADCGKIGRDRWRASAFGAWRRVM